MSEVKSNRAWHEECESLRQQLSTLKAELKCIGEAIDDPRTDLTMTMSELILEYKQQLADSQNQVTLLRDLIPKRIPDGFVSFGKYYAEQESIFNPSYKEMTKFKNKYLSDCEEALAATADLDGLILCDAVVVGWIGTGPRDGRCEFAKSKPANSVMRDFNMKPLYRAWKPE